MILRETSPARSIAAEPSRDSFLVRSISRGRFNVLDLLDFFARPAVTSTIFCSMDMSWVEEERAKLNARGPHVTVTSFLLKAIGIAQKRHPLSRTVMIPWGRMATFQNIVAGLTVERLVDGQPAVFFGEIESPDGKTMAEIATELRSYSEDEIDSVPQLARQRAFSRVPWLLRRFVFWLGARLPAFRLMCMQATFGLSSLGTLGVTSASGPAVCSSVFGVGAVRQEAVVRDGQVVCRPMMTVSLNYDARVMSCFEAARFFTDVRELMEGGLARCNGDSLTERLESASARQDAA